MREQVVQRGLVGAVPVVQGFQGVRFKLPRAICVVLGLLVLVASGRPRNCGRCRSSVTNQRYHGRGRSCAGCGRGRFSNATSSASDAHAATDIFRRAEARLVHLVAIVIGQVVQAVVLRSYDARVEMVESKVIVD